MTSNPDPEPQSTPSPRPPDGSAQLVPTASRPFVVGLCGGIAAGKSAAAAALEEMGYARIDADRIAREVVGRPEVLAALERRFGAEILQEDKTLDRAALAAVVFRDPAARSDLEAITHPPIHRAIESALVDAWRRGVAALLDVPLLFENGWDEHCDEVLFIETPDEHRAARAQDRGWSEEEWRRREAAQLPLPLKRLRATRIITNLGSAAALTESVHRLASGWART